MKFPIITVAGGSCSGKTTFVQGFQKAVVISIDSFYKDLPDLIAGPDGKYDFDTPEAMDLAACRKAAEQLAQGHDVKIPTYDYLSCRRTGEELIKAPTESGWIIVIEGIFTLQPPLQNLGDIRMFIETPVEIRIARRIKRDVARGKDVAEVIEMFIKVEQGHQTYIEPSKKYANLVVPFSYSPIVFS